MPRPLAPVIPLTDSQRELAVSAAPLVKYIAERFAAKLPASVSEDDLIEDGMIGAMNAAKKFDPDRGVKFGTFAAPHIRGAMLDGLRAMDWVPRQVRLRKEPVTQLVSISAVTREADDGRRQTTIDDELPPRHDIGLSELERQDHLRSLLRGLNRQDRIIMFLLYVECLTMKETGLAIGISESSVSQHHASVLERLREKITPEQLCG